VGWLSARSYREGAAESQPRVATIRGGAIDRRTFADVQGTFRLR
jgi:hypothetical protein